MEPEEDGVRGVPFWGLQDVSLDDWWRDRTVVTSTNERLEHFVLGGKFFQMVNHLCFGITGLWLDLQFSLHEHLFWDNLLDELLEILEAQSGKHVLNITGVRAQMSVSECIQWFELGRDTGQGGKSVCLFVRFRGDISFSEG
ncbi:hypothetical protein WICPIJ_005452 [Wickerhamomyces pijperi]|uniref:Uncharacterized protein n=1 Tax=Wickerhamomyces pijperi TaxID=599730 RepID=A0A9P8Q604_WICPI|nr:hypothetical protein WICPIJ_005452 [Wickerhamomyces pijperi]